MEIKRSSNRKNRRKTSYLIILLVLVLTSCGDDKMLESYHALSDSEWQENDVQRFTFDIEDTSTRYDLYFTIKNGLKYPFHNLYVDFKLYYKGSSSDSLIAKGRPNFFLFDPKTGTPMGSGNSGWYSHEFSVLANQVFEQPGTYEIRFQQYMRNESLAEVANVGFALDMATKAGQ